MCCSVACCPPKETRGPKPDAGPEELDDVKICAMPGSRVRFRDEPEIGTSMLKVWVCFLFIRQYSADEMGNDKNAHFFKTFLES